MEIIPPFKLNVPGLFVTATDTGVGKTIATCCICNALHEKFPDCKVRAFKPFASECLPAEGGRFNLDAVAMRKFTDPQVPMDLVNPVRFDPPLAPGVAAEEAGERVDWQRVVSAAHELDEQADFMVVEGAGGLFVPLDPDHPHVTILDLAAHIGYPVLIVARTTLGTLNHTTMTVRLLQERGLHVVGVVMNNFQPQLGSTADDPSIRTNRRWLEKMTGVPVLTVLPEVAADAVVPHEGVMDEQLFSACAGVPWAELMHASKPLV